MADIYERVETLRSSMLKLMPQMFRRMPAQKTGMESNMSMSEFRLIHLFKEKQVYKMSAIAGLMGIPLPTATHIVDKLVKNGFLKRKLDAGDRRVVLINITEKGREAMEESVKKHRDNMKHFMDMLDAEDREKMLKVIGDFAEVMERIAAKLEKKQKIKKGEK
jgi:MarR family transcriptional regulator, organic hydroperoxide resistance regulator